MSIKSDKWIRRMSQEHALISPFSERCTIRPDGAPAISYGLSSYGYDIRVSDEFKIFQPNGGVVDPKKFDERVFREFRGEVCEIPPNSYVLAKSVEYFRIPRDILTICFGKSTYARCGVVVNVTPFEPEWEGHVTLEISNTSPLPAKIYANEGLAQVVFFAADEQADECACNDNGAEHADGHADE